MPQAKKVTAKATYDFSTDTGATGARTLAISETIPNDAIIVACYTHCKTACTSGGAQATSSAAISITPSEAALTAGMFDIYVDYIPA